MHASDPIESLTRLTALQKSALKKLGIATVRDLLYHFPSRYERSADVKTVAELKAGDTASVYGKFTKLEVRRSWRTKVPIADGSFSDGTGTVRVTWFHQPYLAKMVPTDTMVRIRGKVSGEGGKRYIANPVVEKALGRSPMGEAEGVPFMEGMQTTLHSFRSREAGAADAEGRPQVGTADGLFPVYSESAGVSSLWFYHAVKRAFESGVLETVEDPIPEDIRERYHLPPAKTAFVWAHQPKKEKDAEAARKRFAFEEVFLIQLARGLERELNKEKRALEIDADEKRVMGFVKEFPFEPTKAQKKAIADILADFIEPYPMHRLLEGDVGSGKTAVAAAAAYAVVTSRPSGQNFGNLQVAYMCPTEILAKQHFATFTSFFAKHPIQIGLVTSSGCYKFPSKVNPKEATPLSRAQLLRWVENGEIPIVIGTHALIEKSLRFKHLAFVIVDEQHRFGTFQRKEIAEKGGVSPHLLSMTATPIPRTLALTLYGDLDLTILDELPAGRKPIRTESVTPRDRERAYEKIRTLVSEGRQAYVICPRIDEPDPKKVFAVEARSVASETKRLSTKVFPEFKIEKLHSKMTPKDKEGVMGRFTKGETQILVATSVVEVGVNVPNATVIMIEGAERFGLAQLHQLRGRVMRSSHEPWCFLMVERGGENARLKAIQEARNGFELAERDLMIRGAGELYGARQWGLSDIGMDALKNLKLVEAARKEAFALITKDPTLSGHARIRERANATGRRIHFE
ncbi:MAG: ATP-dependent DNA helicase RecG [Patescibacteria group bacterium]